MEKKKKNKKCKICNNYACVCMRVIICWNIPIMFQRLYGFPTVHARQTY